jgi:RinA family phage transcriptional activator
MKLTRATFRHVEAELYLYNETKKEIERMRNDIIHAGKIQQEGGRSGVSNPTASTAGRLTSDKRLQRLEEIVDIIDDITAICDHQRKELIKLKYWTKPQLLTWNGIAQKIHISERQAYVWRDEIVQAIAERLGWR